MSHAISTRLMGPEPKHQISRLLELDRRAFLAGAGATLLSGFSARAAESVPHDETLFAAACIHEDGGFGLALLDENGRLLRSFDLPVRGHDAIFTNDRKTVVVFSRRPGNIATSLPVDGSGTADVFSAGPDRHFYGHGTFSPDGKLLFAAENDFKAAAGKIGIYENGNGYTRIGEFESHGVGPHQLAMMPDGRTLAVCNGGIRTHPSLGRAKLNIPDMKPSLVFIDSADGSLVERHELPPQLHKLSIRHMAISGDSTIVFGCQYEGTELDRPQLLGKVSKGEHIALFDMPVTTVGRFDNYVGSVALSHDGTRFAATSPKGNVTGIFETATGTLLHAHAIQGASGAAWTRQGPAVSTSQGRFITADTTEQFAFRFDNHMTVSGAGTGSHS